MAFEEQLPEWEAEGTQPPKTKRVEGWQPTEKPPASWFNWLFNRTYRSLRELQQKAAEKEEVQLVRQIAEEAKQKANGSIVNAGGVPSSQAGPEADRPAPGQVGRLYIAKDTGRIFIDTGTAWALIATVNWSDIGGKPTSFSPSAHASTHASNGSDPITPAMIGAPSMTTANITYYVDSVNGNDANNGLSPSTPFKTIQAAINKLPKVIDHNVIIKLADGTYNEFVQVIGFVGRGSLTIEGNSSTPTNVKVRQYHTARNLCMTEIRNLEITEANNFAIAVSDCPYAFITNVIIQAAANHVGIRISFANVKISNCTISNRNYAIIGYNVSRIYSDTNSGTGNEVGLVAYEGSTIAKNGTQPSGTIAEQIASGGVIR